MITIVDYKMGNIRSVMNALDYLEIPHRCAETAEQVRLAERLLLPGVGGFGAGMAELTRSGMVESIRYAVGERGVPLLGICLGMQLLAEWGDEGGGCAGLGLISGQVRRMQPNGGLKVPHMGWSAIEVVQPEPLFGHVTPEMDFYFVHSYHLECPSDYVTATVEYGGCFTAAMQQANVFGTQFHPEKSQKQGLAILRHFAKATA